MNGFETRQGLIATEARRYPTGWTPASLFTGGTNGGWWNFSDVSNLRVASDGSGSPPTDGQRVRYCADLSGNGNHLQQLYSAADNYAPQWFETSNGYTHFTNAAAFLTCSRLITTSAFAVIAGILGTAQTATATFIAQHTGAADSGRTIFLANDTSSPYRKARMFANTQSYGNISILGTTEVFAAGGASRIAGTISDGSGNTNLLVAADTNSLLSSEGTPITSSPWTPLNTDFRVNGQGTSSTAGANSGLPAFRCLLALNRAITAQELIWAANYINDIHTGVIT